MNLQCSHRIGGEIWVIALLIRQHQPSELDRDQRFPSTECLQSFINSNETIIDALETQVIMREEKKPRAI